MEKVWATSYWDILCKGFTQIQSGRSAYQIIYKRKRACKQQNQHKAATRINHYCTNHASSTQERSEGDFCSGTRLRVGGGEE